MKITGLAAIAILLVLIGGLAFAAPGWREGCMDFGAMKNNSTGAFASGKGYIERGFRGMGNCTFNCSGAMNCSLQQQGGEGAGFARGGFREGREFNRMNVSARANATQVEEFKTAVMKGDYAAAKLLDGEYHLGGPLFGMLNETTFVVYSRIFGLESQLSAAEYEMMQALGVEKTAQQEPCDWESHEFSGKDAPGQSFGRMRMHAGMNGARAEN